MPSGQLHRGAVTLHFPGNHGPFPADLSWGKGATKGKMGACAVTVGHVGKGLSITPKTEIIDKRG